MFACHFALCAATAMSKKPDPDLCSMHTAELGLLPKSEIQQLHITALHQLKCVKTSALRAYGSLTADCHGHVWSRDLGKKYKKIHSSETAAAGALSLL